MSFSIVGHHSGVDPQQIPNMNLGNVLTLTLLLLLIVSAATIAATNYYSTSFPLTANPISENGNWINGGNTGLNWSNVQTKSGLAFSAWAGGPEYNDPTAVLAGSWPANQGACGVVYIGSFNRTADYFEVELRLNTTITAHSITGYELNYSLRNDGSQYSSIVRWNGALGHFTQLVMVAPRVLNDRDRLCATNVSGKLTLYRNGAEINHAIDTTYTNGSPGIGFDYTKSSEYNQDYGFLSFQVSAPPGGNPAISALTDDRFVFCGLRGMSPLIRAWGRGNK